MGRDGTLLVAGRSTVRFALLSEPVYTAGGAKGELSEYFYIPNSAFINARNFDLTCVDK